MPRLAPALLRTARARSANLARLLPTLRTLADAATELRWLREHVVADTDSRHLTSIQRARLAALCVRRGRGEPLQYLLGTDFFGSLELAVARGVLIPRQETAASAQALAERLAGLSGLPKPLRVLDLCPGSGCLGLLLLHELRERAGADVRLRGVDVSTRALNLARLNAKRIAPSETIDFVRGDVLAVRNGPLPTWLEDGSSTWHVVVANPPYISPKSFLSRNTSRSVRNYEPRLALVPPLLTGDVTDEAQGDVFYKPILLLADQVGASVVMMEVADEMQARRVAAMALAMDVIWARVELWRDEPHAMNHKDEDSPVLDLESGQAVGVSGQGKCRTVVCWRRADQTLSGCA